MNKPNQILNRITGKKSKDFTALTEILYMARDFRALDLILGREFVVEDPEGKVIAKIKQQPIPMKVLNNILKEFAKIKEHDKEEKAAMFGMKKGKSISGRGFPRPRKR